MVPADCDLTTWSHPLDRPSLDPMAQIFSGLQCSLSTHFSSNFLYKEFFPILKGKELFPLYIISAPLRAPPSRKASHSSAILHRLNLGFLWTMSTASTTYQSTDPTSILQCFIIFGNIVYQPSTDIPQKAAESIKRPNNSIFSHKVAERGKFLQWSAPVGQRSPNSTKKGISSAKKCII